MQGLLVNCCFEGRVESLDADLSSDSTRWVSSHSSCQSKKDGRTVCQQSTQTRSREVGLSSPNAAH